MYCTKCGKELEENWKVCPNCGQKVEYKNISVAEKQIQDYHAGTASEKGFQEEKEGESSDKMGKYNTLRFWGAMISGLIIGVVMLILGSPITGILILIAGILLCPRLLNKYTWKKRIFLIITAIILCTVGAMFYNGDTEDMPEYTGILSDKETNGDSDTDIQKDAEPISDDSRFQVRQKDVDNGINDLQEKTFDTTTNQGNTDIDDSIANDTELWFLTYDKFSKENLTGSLEINVMNDALMFVQCTGVGGDVAEWEFDLQHSDIGQDGELIYYYEKSVSMRYYPNDHHIYIDADDNYAGEYWP